MKIMKEMKAIGKIGIFSMLVIVLLAACESSFKPIQEVNDIFKSMYPNATRVDWEMENGYYVVEFRYDGHETEAWFDTDANWLMTETDYGRKAPEVIQTYINSSDYKDWRIDDVDYIEIKDKEAFYVIELEKGGMDKDLFFNASGEFLTEKSGVGNHRYTPWDK